MHNIQHLIKKKDKTKHTEKKKKQQENQQGQQSTDDPGVVVVRLDSQLNMSMSIDNTRKNFIR